MRNLIVAAGIVGLLTCSCASSKHAEEVSVDRQGHRRVDTFGGAQWGGAANDWGVVQFGFGYGILPVECHFLVKPNMTRTDAAYAMKDAWNTQNPTVDCKASIEDERIVVFKDGEGRPCAGNEGHRLKVACLNSTAAPASRRPLPQYHEAAIDVCELNARQPEE